MAAVAVQRPVGAYVAAADRYVAGVLSGKIPAARYLRQACERQAKDRKRALLRDWPYRFDVTAAERPCKFIEMLPHTKGQWADRRELIHLEDWQCFLVCVGFGWLRKKNNRRRFREFYWAICRKNGKSQLAAAIGLFMWSMDRETGAEVYSGATTEKQAWEVFRPARLMVEKSPDLVAAVGGRRLFDVVRAKSLVIPEDFSKFEPIIGKPGDGASPSCAIADEFHEHDTSDLVDTMKTGMLAREQPLLIQITTAGTNLAGPCYDKHLYCLKLLDGSYENDELFAVIYTIDEQEYIWRGEVVPADDWTTPAALRKANPNLGVSVDLDILEADQRQAVLNPVDQNRFKTKHMNIWCSAKTSWMPLTVWDACADPNLRAEEFMGEPAIFVLDLASKDDIAAFTLLFKKRLKEIDHYFTFATYYLPEDAIEVPGPNQVAYRRWVRDGRIITTDGAEIDFDRIAADVLDAKNKFQLRELAYDPWRATQLAHQMQKAGATVVELRQTVQNMSLPMKEVLSASKAGRLHHDGNPVTRWMMSNVVAKHDGKDNIYPRKVKDDSPMKIDGAVALIMGMARAMASQGQATYKDWLNDPVTAQ